ncbi:nucleoside 2-deoxyribosyltransferase [Verrucomicrobium sp. BvORR034]|uniref:nucleoside 2-deoxyribosyltransferase n=1 Tax=Verrucomicrobium sp. BvORR034 TaxID=1396418 RepID=UPI002240F516|nr:nucleoside 2-deoxyribosyltransferase [Verrucomicrobium sp. BvORR034]
MGHSLSADVTLQEELDLSATPPKHADMRAPATTQPKVFSFVLMPFDKSFNDIYRLGIKEACKATRVYCERVDEQDYHERILDRIYNQISKADFVIADMTGKNPNVFYEVGYAHALGKRVILLTQRAEDIPFDLKHFPHIIYGDNGDSISELKTQLGKKIKSLLLNKSAPSISASDGLDIWINGMRNKPVIDYPLPPHNRTIIVSLQNNSGRIHEHGESKAGFLVKRNSVSLVCILTTIWAEDKEINNYLTLPNGDLLFRHKEVPRLFPEETYNFELDLHHHSGWPKEDKLVDFRLYTSTGVRDQTLRFYAVNVPDPLDFLKA